ncbi:hypothetical protein ACEPAH_1795 [Sanghuangporus vaninii]
MPVKAFLEDFSPPTPDASSMPRSSAAFRGVPSNPRNERDIYIPLAEAINNDKRCPSVTFCNTADRRACARRRVPGPALCGYASNDIRSITKENDGNFIQEDVRSRYELNLGLAEIFVVVRKDHDPFCDHHIHKQCESGSHHEGFFCFENREYVKQSDFDAGKQEKRNLGQSVHHVADACSRQHRAFYFSILGIVREGSSPGHSTTKNIQICCASFSGVFIMLIQCSAVLIQLSRLLRKPKRTYL